MIKEYSKTERKLIEQEDIKKVKETIKKENDQLGFVTEFFHQEKGVMGYTENGVIYLNTAYPKFKMVNKREILHHFERHPYFITVKEAIMNKLDSKTYDELYKDYLLKYGNLYSQKEIKRGVIDNEIVIDIIIGNGVFNAKIKNFAKDFYSEIITCLQKWAKSKRYSTYSIENEQEDEM